MWRLEPQDIREEYPKRRVRHQSSNLLRVLERRAEKGKVKSHVDSLKNRNKRSSEGPERHDKTENETLNFHLRVSPFARFCNDEAPQCVEIGW